MLTKADQIYSFLHKHHPFGISKHLHVQERLKEPMPIKMVKPASLDCSALLAKDFEEWMESYKWTWSKSGGRIEHIRHPQTRPGVPSTPSSPSTLASQDTDEKSTLELSSPALITSSSSISSTPGSPYSSFSSAPSSWSFTTAAESKPSSQPTLVFTTEYFDVRQSHNKGLGAFSNQDIEKGTAIMAEKPLFKTECNNVFFCYEQLTAEERKEYLSLHCHIGNYLHRVPAIFETNRFAITRSVGGIFLKSSRFNHACREYRNCSYAYDADLDLLVTKACRAIAKGEELTISYAPSPVNLPQNYGFYCDCPACPEPEVAKANERMMRGY